MNQKLQYIGLLAILPLAMVALSPDFIGTADAAKFKAQPVAELEDLSLIQVIAPQESKDTPIIGQNEFTQPSAENEQTNYRTVYKVASDVDNAVKNVKILVNSDTESVTEMLRGNLDDDHSVISVMIKAVDPASINAQIVEFENKY